jgi:putative acetyltransferase
MKFSLRPYRDSDWPELLAVWTETWQQSRPDVDFAARAPWLADLFAESLGKGAKIIVAEDNKGLLGFVLFDPDREWLEQIAVHWRSWGSGAAQALIRSAKESCPGGIGLEVNADNRRALAFYHCEGFQRLGAGRMSMSGLPTLALRWEP